jgi:hypothetical protein
MFRSRATAVMWCWRADHGADVGSWTSDQVGDAFGAHPEEPRQAA